MTGSRRPFSPLSAGLLAGCLVLGQTAAAAALDGESAPAPAEVQSAAPTEKVYEVELIKERYANGKVKVEREVTQDSGANYINHGTWQQFDEAGNVLAQGHYHFGNRDGSWARWFRTAAEAPLLAKPPFQQYNAPFVSQATFKDNKLEGVWTIHDAKKHKIVEWHFADGHRHGMSTWWYANGRKMREVPYKHGDIEGELLEWDQDGKLVTKETFQEGHKLAKKSEKYSDATKKSEGVYLFAKLAEQTPDDWWSLKLQTFTKAGNDEKHGTWIAWHPGGKQMMEGAYEHDQQVGLFTWWHPNGQKALEGRFVDGKQEGRWSWWHPNGQKAIRGDYEHGVPIGRWTWWTEAGKIATAADLSHSEGVVIDTPAVPEPNQLPTATKPIQQKPLRR